MLIDVTIRRIRGMCTQLIAQLLFFSVGNVDTCHSFLSSFRFKMSIKGSMVKVEMGMAELAMNIPRAGFLTTAQTIRYAKETTSNTIPILISRNTRS